MTKVIRISDKTFKDTVERNKWSDTIDATIGRPLNQAAEPALSSTTKEADLW